MKVLGLGQDRLRTGTSALKVRILIKDVCALQSLRDRVLSGAIQDDINKALSDPEWDVPVQVDKSRFFELYEENMLALNKLTPHQQEKLAAIGGHVDVHLSAPAGAGKTFVSVQHVLNILQSDPPGYVLYVAPRRELIYHFQHWILVRLATQASPEDLTSSSIQDLLSRMLVLHEPK